MLSRVDRDEKGGRRVVRNTCEKKKKKRKSFLYFHFTSSFASTSFSTQPAPASAGEESEEDQQFRTIFQEIAGDVSMRKREFLTMLLSFS